MMRTVVVNEDEYAVLCQGRMSERLCPLCAGGVAPESIFMPNSCELCEGRGFVKPSHNALPLYDERRRLQQALSAINKQIVEQARSTK